MPSFVLRREGRRLDTHCREGHAQAEAETRKLGWYSHGRVAQQPPEAEGGEEDAP